MHCARWVWLQWGAGSRQGPQGLLLSWSFLCSSASSPCGSAQSWPAVPAQTPSVGRAVCLPSPWAPRQTCSFTVVCFCECWLRHRAVPSSCLGTAWNPWLGLRLSQGSKDRPGLWELGRCWPGLAWQCLAHGGCPRAQGTGRCPALSALSPWDPAGVGTWVGTVEVWLCHVPAAVCPR